MLDPQYVDNPVISAYAVWISAEDINSSFSMWNFDVRSDDAYKGRQRYGGRRRVPALEGVAGHHDHQLEHLRYVGTPLQRHLVPTRRFRCSARWTPRAILCATVELPRCVSCAATAISFSNVSIKNIPFAVDENLSPGEYNDLEHRLYQRRRAGSS